jgi:hypothetical protein
MIIINKFYKKIKILHDQLNGYTFFQRRRQAETKKKSMAP